MTRFADRLLEWYRRSGRKLPWRGQPDPYAVWVSEIMLQQTRVEAVIPYYERWIRLFPDLPSLAGASQQQVLKAWEGLGYYSRARHLHTAAKIVLSDFGGKLPADPEQLIQLPGIGRYTAGAIASIAFGLDAPVLDGNIRRVLARVFNVDRPVDTGAGEKIVWSLAGRHLPHGRAGDFNQALMDLGALICLPRNPKCRICPVVRFCQARKLGVQDRRPVVRSKAGTPHFLQVTAVVVKNRRVLLAQRPPRGLLAGMWEFPNGRVENLSAREMQKTFQRNYHLRVHRTALLGVFEHAYTHFRVTAHAFYCEWISSPQTGSLKWVRLAELDEFPMGGIDRKIARKLG